MPSLRSIAGISSTRGSLWWRDLALHPVVAGDRHAQRAAEGFEQCFGLVVGVETLEVIKVRRHGRVVDETLEKLAQQIQVEVADARAGVRHVVEKAGAPRQIDDHAREGFVQRHVGVSIAINAALVPYRLRKRLAEHDAHVFHGMVRVDLEITPGFDV